MRRIVLTAIAIIAMGLFSSAGDKEYRAAALLDLQMVGEHNGYGRAGEIYCLAVSFDGLNYLLHYGPIWAYGYAPADLIVGDTVQVRIHGNNLYLKKPKGGEIKTEVTRREKLSTDKPPLACGEAVTVRH